MENNPPDNDRFSPVLQMRSARVVIAVAAQLNMKLVTLDFPKAFLLGKMDAARPIFMHAPHGFAKFPGAIYEILLPLYGLTVSSRRFYESLSEFMRALGFQHFAGGDPCLFRRPRNMPTTKEIAANNLAAQKWDLPPRPSGAPPVSPKPSRSGTAPTHEHPCPERFDQPEYKSTPNARFEPFHAEGLAPDAINGLFAGTHYEMAGACVDDLLVATHTSAQTNRR
jgi:hypothetical protein